MLFYDILPNGAQIKCFYERRTRHLKVGDEVGGLDRLPTYIILLREGGYIRVADRKIAEIVEDGWPYSVEDFEYPEYCYAVFDKWGDRISPDNDLMHRGGLGEPYYFSEGE